jgi:hypothetical protein
MAIILKFPAKEVEARRRVEKQVWVAMENHAPETREEKHRAVMEEYDLSVSLNGPITITLENPISEPFSQLQIQAVTDAMNHLGKECAKYTENILRRIILLKLQMVDLEISLRK